MIIKFNEFILLNEAKFGGEIIKRITTEQFNNFSDLEREFALSLKFVDHDEIENNNLDGEIAKKLIKDEKLITFHNFTIIDSDGEYHFRNSVDSYHSIKHNMYYRIYYRTIFKSVSEFNEHFENSLEEIYEKNLIKLINMYHVSNEKHISIYDKDLDFTIVFNLNDRITKKNTYNAKIFFKTVIGEKDHKTFSNNFTLKRNIEKQNKYISRKTDLFLNSKKELFFNLIKKFPGRLGLARETYRKTVKDFEKYLLKDKPGHLDEIKIWKETDDSMSKFMEDNSNFEHLIKRPPLNRKVFPKKTSNFFRKKK